MDVVAKNLAGILNCAHVLRVLVAVTLDSFSQHFGVHALDRRLARRIDVGHEQHIGVIEGAGEFVHQIIRPRVAMRLKQSDYAPVRSADARRAQGRFDLRRVVTVVVDHHHARFVTLELKTPISAAEFTQRGLHRPRQARGHAEHRRGVVPLSAP